MEDCPGARLELALETHFGGLHGLEFVGTTCNGVFEVRHSVLLTDAAVRYHLDGVVVAGELIPLRFVLFDRSEWDDIVPLVDVLSGLNESGLVGCAVGASCGWVWGVMREMLTDGEG